MIKRLLPLLLALAALIAIPQTSSAAVPTVKVSGDLPMRDGVTLHYTYVRPAKAQKLPTLFEYSGYDPGTNPDKTYIKQYVESGAGYNYLGVSIRGTGCSTGTFDFFQPAESKDGAAVVAWIRKQPWSNGKVGMIGKSYPGITQLFVAAENPPGLLAIAPGHFFGDAYRDVARPGGIQNYGFASLWSFIAQPSYGVQSNPANCPARFTAPVQGLPTNPFVQLQSHLFDDPLYRQRSPQFTKIKAAVFATEAWQDEQLASRGTDLLAQLDDLGKKNWWLDVTNGDHGMMRTSTGYADLRSYYDYTLKGIKNDWAKRPRVKVWWDSTVARRVPTWVTGMQHWSEKQRTQAGLLKPLALNLRGDGSLLSQPAVSDPARTYAYAPVVGSQGIGNPRYGGVGNLPDFYLWSQKPAPLSSLQWTTPALTSDLTLLGSASLDLWLSSTAPDTDLQVTLSEVRPDGQEMYLEKGWLKVSQRKLDPRKSTVLRPFQTHTQQDVQLLTPGTAVPARVEVFPFGALIRKGSKIRVSVEAPTALPELWAFAASPVPAVNTILSDAQHPSRLVLPVVPNDQNRHRVFPACGTLIREPCR